MMVMFNARYLPSKLLRPQWTALSFYFNHDKALAFDLGRWYMLKIVTILNNLKVWHWSGSREHFYTEVLPSLENITEIRVPCFCEFVAMGITVN